MVVPINGMLMPSMYEDILKSIFSLPSKIKVLEKGVLYDNLKLDWSPQEPPALWQ